MKHLSSEQISKVTAGLYVPEEAHILECAQCAAELERSREMLSQFGWSIREWTARQQPRDWAPRSPRVSHRSPVAWALAGAALAIVVAAPVYRDSRERQIKEQAERDARLIDDVNAQLSRRGPAVLQNLMQMMNDSDSAGGHAQSKGGLQ
jgi:hypothetical protein